MVPLMPCRTSVKDLRTSYQYGNVNNPCVIHRVSFCFFLCGRCPLLHGPERFIIMLIRTLAGGPDAWFLFAACSSCKNTFLIGFDLQPLRSEHAPVSHSWFFSETCVENNMSSPLWRLSLPGARNCHAESHLR